MSKQRRWGYYLLFSWTKKKKKKKIPKGSADSGGFHHHLPCIVSPLPPFRRRRPFLMTSFDAFELCVCVCVFWRISNCLTLFTKDRATIPSSFILSKTLECSSSFSPVSCARPLYFLLIWWWWWCCLFPAVVRHQTEYYSVSWPLMALITFYFLASKVDWGRIDLLPGFVSSTHRIHFLVDRQQVFYL